MARGGAQRINACHSRTYLAIGNSRGRYVGDGVDRRTHRILPWRCAREQKEMKTKPLVLKLSADSRPIVGPELQYYRALGAWAIASEAICQRAHRPIHGCRYDA